MDSFPERLERLMKERGIKQADICRATGISTSLMSNYSTGRVSPKLSKATAIADALGVSLDDLLGMETSTADVINQPILTDLERRLILAFRRLAPSVQSLAVQLVENLNPDGDKSKREPKDSKPERLERSA